MLLLTCRNVGGLRNDGTVPKRKASSFAAEAAFRTRLIELGATLLESEWLGCQIKHHALCAAGHDCYPTPLDAQKAKGICRVCAGNDPATAETAFRARLAEVGAELLEPKWLGALKPHRVRCSAGHECSPRPSDVRNGHGICRACVGRDPAVAEVKFRGRLTELGAEMLGPYVNSKTPVAVRCAAGHDCMPTPGGVIRGGGVCLKCAGMDLADSEAKFLACLAELGATPAYDRYRGANKPHRVICVGGHECYPRPGGVRLGGGVCIACAGKDPAAAETAFKARLEELGATLLEPEWRGVGKPHLVRCPEGHLTRPMPTNVQQGSGICRFCAGSEWDAFYVVTGTGTGVVKFGITTGNGQRRLAVHASKGLANVVYLVAGLPGTVALDAENAVKAALAAAREKPVRGREYFDISTLPLILDVAGSWLPQQTAPGCLADGFNARHTPFGQTTAVASQATREEALTSTRVGL